MTALRTCASPAMSGASRSGQPARPVHLRQTCQQKRQIVVFAGVTPSPAPNRIDAPAASTRSGRWSASPKSDEKGSDLLASGGRRDVTDVRRQIAAVHRRTAQLRKKSATPLVFSASSADKTQFFPPRGVAYPFAPPSASFVGNGKHTPKTTNCRFSQHFTCAHEQKTSHEATQNQVNATDRTRAALSDSSGMKVLNPPSLS